MELVLATNNRDKVREIRQALADLPITIHTAADFPDFPDPLETGETLEENALLKARAIAQYAGLPALADDSGLEVDALSGAPGVFSSRYAGEDVTYEDNYSKLLREMTAVPEKARTARFRCVMALAWQDGSVETVEGLAEGLITTAAGGKQGFGYDPVFFYPPLGKRFSELTIDQKNQVSHRGKALRAIREILMRRLGRPA